MLHPVHGEQDERRLGSSALDEFPNRAIDGAEKMQQRIVVAFPARVQRMIRVTRCPQVVQSTMRFA